MKKKKICIVGTGGFGRETLVCLIDSLSEQKQKIADLVVFMEKDDYQGDSIIMGIPVIKERQFVAENYKVVVAIGDPRTRKKIISKLPPKTEYTTIIHPSAVIPQGVVIGEGSVITAGTIITCNIKFGKHTQLNLHTTVGHDCEMGDFFTTAPGVNISGKCKFGDCVYFGTNASVKEGIQICDNVVIGMGGVVVKNITQEGVYIGNPIRKLEKY